MALTIRAAARRTHKYRDGWASLDDWSESHQFKMLGGCVVREGNGIDDEGAILHRVIGSKTVDQELQARALHDTLSGSNCRHDFDCCGCRSTWARVRRVKPGIFSVLITTSRNY